SPSTSMYSTSMPHASNRRSGASAGGLELFSGIDARLEDFHDPIVQLVADHGVLDAAIDVRVVVDLHQHVPTVDRLDVDTVQPVTDRVGGVQGELNDFARGVLDGYRFGLSLFRAFLAVVVDLPVAVGHVVATREQRLAVEHSDAP